jgi:hypothetical protein
MTIFDSKGNMSKGVFVVTKIQFHKTRQFWMYQLGTSENGPLHAGGNFFRERDLKLERRRGT